MMLVYLVRQFTFDQVNHIAKNKNPKKASTASPLFSHLKYYPLINEIVLFKSASFGITPVPIDHTGS